MNIYLLLHLTHHGNKYRERKNNIYSFLQMASRPCVITSCKNASRALCNCCNQYLCRTHLNEHDDLLNSQLNPLVDEINILGDRLNAINFQQMIGDSHEKLDKWRVDSHRMIDRFYQQKCEELDRCIAKTINKQREDIAQMRSKVARLIEKQEATHDKIDSLASSIRSIEQVVENIQQMCVQVDIRSLVIDDSLIHIESWNMHQFDLATLPSAYQTIKYSGESSVELTS